MNRSKLAKVILAVGAIFILFIIFINAAEGLLNSIFN